MKWIVLALKRFNDFEGRSRRKEYWMFVLAHTTILLPLAILQLQLELNLGNSWLWGALTIPYQLLVFLPYLAVQVRRFHDLDKSGWYTLLSLIPYLGGIAVVILMCMNGTQGTNRFGPDPKDADEDLNEIFA